MKCIKRDGEVRRVSDDEAMAKVESGWSYCPKEEWKALREKPEPAAESSKSSKRRERKEQKDRKQPRSTSKYAQKKRSQERAGENIDENYTQEAPLERQKTALEILDEMDD